MGDDYNRLPVNEKQRVARERIREPSVQCPYCETKTTVDNLLTHVQERCTGTKLPHQFSRWIDHAEALRLGVRRQNLSRWVTRGIVRIRPTPRGRQYLKRDVVRALAARISPGKRR